MIKYKLKCKAQFCSKNKDFDGWFQNIKSYEEQKNGGLITCPTCGSDNIVKSLTAPNLKKSVSQKHDKEIKKQSDSDISGIDNNKVLMTILRTLKREVQKNSTFVGDDFVQQARAMKKGTLKEKAIHGYGSNNEIEELKDEGIDVVDIPWVQDDH